MRLRQSLVWEWAAHAANRAHDEEQAMQRMNSR